MRVDYSIVTELPGSKITSLQLERSYHRYKFASNYCSGKRVLEVACGGGQGLSLLASKAKKVVGGDCDEKNLSYARATYRGCGIVDIMDLDALHMPFDRSSFDVIVLYEAIYYLESVEKFLNECRRVLSDDGVVIACTANKDWPDFNPSPFSTRYYSIPEMWNLFENEGFSVRFYGAFPDVPCGLTKKLKSFIKRCAVRTNIMPKSMKGKVLFKRIFFGSMVEMPRKLNDGILEYIEPTPLPHDREDDIHTAIYAVARLNRN